MDKREKGNSSKAEVKTDYATTLSVAEKATASSVDDNRACSDGRSGEDKYGGYKRTGARCRDSF